MKINDKSKNLVPAIVIAKPETTAKADLEVMSREVAKITTKCCRANIEILDCIVTFGGIKDIKKRVVSLLQQMDFKFVMVYSGVQIAESEEEFLEFVEELERFYGLYVKRLTL